MKKHVAASLRTLACLALIAGGAGINAHPEFSEVEQVRHSVLAWTSGMLSADPSQVDPVLHDEFSMDHFTWTRVGETIDKATYLRDVVTSTQNLKAIYLQYADFEFGEAKVVVSPIVVERERGGITKSTLSLALVKVNEEWLITGVGPGGELPLELTTGVIPERSILYTVRIAIRDADTGLPIETRVHVRDSEGEYWPPNGHMKHIHLGMANGVGGDVKVNGRTYAYVSPDFEVLLPEGSYEMEVVRGIEYEPEFTSFTVRAGEIPEVEVSLQRWSNMQAQGWYSGDTHVHFMDPHTAKLELLGENLNVVNILATKLGSLIANVEHFTGEQSVLSEPERIVYVNEELRHNYLGHTILLGLEEIIYPISWGPPHEGEPGGYDFPPMAYQVDKAHEQDAVVSWAHFPFPNGEVAIDIALNKIDAIDLVTWTNPFDETVPTPPARVYYRFLNTGAKLPALGGTDKMMNTQVMGGVRTYVNVDGPFSYDGWLDGIRAGRTFVTTGPMLSFSAGESRLGDTIEAATGDVIPLHAEVNSYHPVDRIEIIQDGQIVAVVENPELSRKVTLTSEVTIKESSWLAARAISSEILTHQTWDILRTFGIPVLAHTSPIYVDVEGQPRTSAEDAAYLAEWCDATIEWARTAHYHNEEQREEVLELYERAKAFYTGQID